MQLSIRPEVSYTACRLLLIKLYEFHLSLQKKLKKLLTARVFFASFNYNFFTYPILQPLWCLGLSQECPASLTVSSHSLQIL